MESEMVAAREKARGRRSGASIESVTAVVHRLVASCVRFYCVPTSGSPHRGYSAAPLFFSAGDAVMCAVVCGAKSRLV